MPELQGGVEVPPRRSLAFILPVYNEEEVIPQLMEAVDQFRASYPEVEQVIFIDDGSRDNTAALIRELAAERDGVLLLRFSRNFGHQLAITAGIAMVEADAAVILDADLQDPIEVVEEMIVKWREGYDVVYGQRAKREGEKSYKLWTAAAYYRFFRWMSDLDMPLDTGDFRLISRPVIDAYNQLDDPQPFVRGLISWLGFKQIGVSYVRAPRAAGSSKYSLGKMIRFALNGLTAFSEKPLRLATRFGVATAFLSFAGIILYLLFALVSSTPISALTLLVFTGFFFGGVQLLVLGMIGVYLLRIYNEVKGRPRYVVQSVWRSGP